MDKTTTYCIIDTYGNEVEISAKTAWEFYRALEREAMREEVLLELKAICKDEGIDVNSVSDASIDAIVNTYAQLRNKCEGDWYSLTTAIDKHFDAIFAEARLADKPKTAER